MTSKWKSSLNSYQVGMITITNFSFLMRHLFYSCVATMLLVSCHTKNDYETVFNDPQLYAATVFELNNVVMGNNFSPIVASRNYLYANVAAYEIIAAGDPKNYRSLAGQVRDLQTLPQPLPQKKVNFEFASLMAFCN